MLIRDVTEDHALNHPQCVGSAEHSVVAAINAIQKPALKELKMTMNSPTKPDVPGKPAFAIAKNTISAAKVGMVLTTPP